MNPQPNEIVQECLYYGGKTLHLSGLQVNDTFLEVVDPHLLSDVDFADISGTEIGDKGLVVLMKSCRLSELHAVSTRVEWREVPNGLVDEAKFELLDLSYSHVGDASLPSIARLPQLKSLFLDGTGVSDKGMTQVSTMSRLEALSVSETRIGNESLKP